MMRAPADPRRPLHALEPGETERGEHSALDAPSLDRERSRRRRQTLRMNLSCEPPTDAFHTDHE